MGVPFVIRVPLVPSVTDTESNLLDIVRLVKELPSLLRVELLPYNRAAGGKYGPLGLKFNPGFVGPLDSTPNIDIFRNEGLEVCVA